MAATQKQAKVSPDLVQVWERRFVNPGAQPGASITLKDPSFTVRWINTTQEGRFHQASREEGWVAVRPDELADEAELLGLQTGDGNTVRRGDRGQEVLMKIPNGVFDKIRRRKAELNLNALKKTKGLMAEAIGKTHGPNAAEFVAGSKGAAGKDISGMTGEIVDNFEAGDLDSD